MPEEPRAFYEVDSLSTELYDVRSATIIPASPMAGDVDFYRALAGELGGPVLEVGCGTGRVSIPLAEAGFDVVGVDLSMPMLGAAEQRRASLSPEVASRLTFIEGDMTSLALGRQFPLVITPSRVFQFALTSESQRAALRSLKAHLQPGGRLVLDLFDPRLELVVPGAPWRPRGGELIHPRTGNRVTWEVTDRNPRPAEQLIIEDWTDRELAPSGAVLREVTERLTLRWTTRSEMRLLFELEGLAVEAEYGDFAGAPPAYGLEQVWVLSAAATP